MKILVILLSALLFTFTTHATNCHKEGGHSHDEVTTNGLSSGEITDNFININVNGMVCDFCAQSIEKVFMKRIEVKGINVNNKELNKIINIFMFFPFKNV
jgi:Mg2+/Co2+ transporter CorB